MLPALVFLSCFVDSLMVCFKLEEMTYLW